MVTPVSISKPAPIPTSLPTDHQAHPVRPAATPHPTARATTAARPRPLHPAPLSLVARVGGDAAEVLAEVRRRLDVTPRLAALIATAASSARLAVRADQVLL